MAELLAAIGDDLYAGGFHPPARLRVPVVRQRAAGPQREDVRPHRFELGVGHFDQTHVPLLQQLDEPSRQKREVGDGQVAVEWAEQREQVEDLAAAVQMRDVEAAQVGYGSAQRFDAGLVRAVGVAGEERPVVEADQVAALGFGRGFQPSHDRYPGVREVALECSGLTAAALLARPQQNDPLLRHERGVEGVDVVQVPALGRRREDDLHAGLLEQDAEPLVLPA